MPKARRAARNLADVFGETFNLTVSRAPIRSVEVQDASEPFAGFIAHCKGDFPAPMPLENGSYLYLRQHVCLRRKERYLTTLGYYYRYQATEAGSSWIWRYEYHREPSNPRKPHCHFHVNARPLSYTGPKSFESLHLPAGRVTVEAIAQHLVDDHGIKAISPGWRAALDKSEAEFDAIQRKR